MGRKEDILKELAEIENKEKLERQIGDDSVEALKLKNPELFALCQQFWYSPEGKKSLVKARNKGFKR